MCGIFGHIGPIPEELAANCTNVLAHRGPDGFGLWCQQEVTLGHRRLSILDLTEQGRQPMSYADGRYWITYNGEIYNFIEIRANLKARGHVFRSDSDTEVVLAAYAEWGEKCLDLFNGMWAFAIWDSTEKSLFLARDRFGKKPLFYSWVPRGFAFASEMKALFPLMEQVRPNVKLVTNPKCMFQYESTEECVIEEIRRFPAGHYGWYRDSKLILKRWWCTLDHLVDVPHRYEDQVEQLRELFIDACRIRMRSDVPIGTALSGGLDSSATISVMAHLGRKDKSARVSDDWQNAYVATFPGTPLDEANFAQKVTDYLKINATFIEIDPLKTINRMEEYFYLFEDLYITSPIPFMMTYEAIKKDKIKVSIDGHGADELYAGYGFDYLTALKDAGLNLDKINMILQTRYDATPQDSTQFKMPPKLPFWFKWHFNNAKQELKKSLIRKFRSKDASHPLWKNLDNLNKTLYQSTHDTILPTLLRNYDRYSMANGVEIRMPFLDYRLVVFAFSIPWTSKIRNGFSKSIIRDAVSSYMPAEVAYRKSKIGFNSPIVDWMKGPLKEYFLDIIDSASFRNCQLIYPAGVRANVKHVIEDPNVSFQAAELAWTQISPYLWEQAVIKRTVKE